MNGFVNINKPKGITSSDVVVRVRNFLSRVFSLKVKAGHLGTLDPDASGVLPVALGSATKLFDFFIKKEKHYTAEFTFNTATDTLDSSGKITEERNVAITKEAVLEAIKAQTGEVMQIPPQYSALSVGGERAYALARAGKGIELAARRVIINSIEYVSHSHIGDKYIFNIECMGGTYIRSIARDLARALGTVGHMSGLVRTKSGIFTLKDAVTLEEFYAAPLDRIKSIDECLPYPVYILDEKYAPKVQNGMMPEIDGLPEQTLFKVFIGEALFGLGENNEGRLKILVRL